MQLTSPQNRGRDALSDQTKRLILASGTSPTPEEERILKLAHWMGVETERVSVDQDSALARLGEGGGQRCCLAMSADTLALTHRVSSNSLEKLVKERCAELLVFGCGDPRLHSRALSWVTSGAISGVNVAAQGQKVCELPRGGRGFSRQLAGLSFSTGHALSAPTFDRAINGASANAIMITNGQPAFIRLALPSVEMFLLAGAGVPDIDEPLSPGSGLEAYYDRLIPILIFLRHSFGKTCWHGPVSTARFIIDDPLLTEKYGFLNYRALLSSMERERYGTSVAFIPWNYRRTSTRTASRLFGGRPDLSICVHGCDHSNKEFDSADQAFLESRAGLALERMERHEARTGLPFERVMVFPQGRFSSRSMLALRTAGYLAAVDSNCFPTDEESGPLRIGDFLRPAITRLHGFPLFQRRYPRRLMDAAFDLFLGRPALLGEHHEYFRGGCQKVEEFVSGLRNVEPTLTWPTLSAQLTRSCIMRAVSRDSVEVLFFTRRFRVENTDGDLRRFRLTKHEPDPAPIRAVYVDGVSVPFSFEGDCVVVEVEVEPGRARDVEIVDQPRPARGAGRVRLMDNVGAVVRRGLSEFRDNRLARHPRLLGAATRLAKALNVTGDHNDGGT